MGRAREIAEGFERAEQEEERIGFDRATGRIEPEREPTDEPEAPQTGYRPSSVSVQLPTNIYD